MPLRELEAIWHGLHPCARRLVAGEWMESLDEQGEPVVRRIIDGILEVWAWHGDEGRQISEAGKGEFVGIRSAIYPDSSIRLIWKARTPVLFEEVSFSALRWAMLQSARGFSLLEHLARVRTYSLAVALHPLFGKLPRLARGRLMSAGWVRMLRDGEVLIDQDELPLHERSLYLVLDGELIVMQQGREIARRQRGSVVGEISLFGFSHSPVARVMSCGTSEILVFPGSEVLGAARACSEFRQWLAGLAQRRMFEGIDQFLTAPEALEIATDAV